MSGAAPVTVALAETRWVGHHPTYYQEFVASLLRTGARVMALCPEPEAFLVTAARLFPGSMERLKTAKLQVRNTSLLGGHLDNDPAIVAGRWLAVRRALDRLEDSSGWRADLVFFCYLDAFIRYMPLPRIPDLLLGRWWSGLYFRNHHLGWSINGPMSRLKRLAKGDAIFRSRMALPIGVLDERFDDAFSEVSGRAPIQFPDITDETPPNGRMPLAEEIRRAAAGRSIVGMIVGEKRKGLMTMLKVAEQTAGKEPWFFVSAGPVCRDTFSADEWQWIGKFMATRPENVWMDFAGQRIPDGAPFNGVFSLFDVVYGAREDFQGSSNALTKAAIFRKPVLATRGECTGRRVEDFGMGLCIDQGNVSQAIAALRHLVRSEDGEGRPLQPRFDDYHRQHDRRRLDEVFTRIIAEARVSAG